MYTNTKLFILIVIKEKFIFFVDKLYYIHLDLYMNPKKYR